MNADMAARLKRCEGYTCIFSLVKEAVGNTLHESRSGLMLALQKLPEGIGALYPVGTNFIVLNKTLLAKVSAIRDDAALKSYIFYVLLHEYLHSLDHLDEGEVYRLSYEICKAVLGEGHESTLIARHGIGAVFPELSMMPAIAHDDEAFEIVPIFDTDDLGYIG